MCPHTAPSVTGSGTVALSGPLGNACTSVSTLPHLRFDICLSSCPAFTGELCSPRLVRTLPKAHPLSLSCGKGLLPVELGHVEFSTLFFTSSVLSFRVRFAGLLREQPWARLYKGVPRFYKRFSCTMVLPVIL